MTFAPVVNVENAEIEGAPFAGTPVGGCIAAKFRAAHAPKFSVGKSFSLD